MNAHQLTAEINCCDFSKYLSDLNAFTVFINGFRGVAIENKNNVVIKEKYNKIFLENCIFLVNGEEKNVLFLYMKSNQIPEQFGIIALDFISTSRREMIMNSPFVWFEEWQDLIGDSKKRKMIFDVIGEMAVLYNLQKEGKKPIWNSTEKGTFDISTDDNIFEVKSTTSKSVDCITVHNQFQLDTQNLTKPLYIAFVRLEDNNDGESIETLYNKLILKGFDKNVLDSYLEQQGFYPGKLERIKKFIIHEIRLYLVDDKFPKITFSDFVGGTLPNSIVKLEYTVSLDGLEYIKM